ncbi:Protein kinase domain-containing protein [Forsythia ovata]|uniref:Protein kinase domain-containing protein n=1 Tax=Forsythia ovata TaxID=205694 RepID=A0ABD1VN52_9LAMI
MHANVEYGSEGIVSTSGDVYSFGIMLLEMYMRKKPTDAMFGEKMSLKSWVSQSLDEKKIIEVVDANLLSREDTNFSAKEQSVIEQFSAMDRRLFEAVVKGDVSGLHSLMEEDENIIKQIVPGSKLHSATFVGYHLSLSE